MNFSIYTTNKNNIVVKFVEHKNKTLDWLNWISLNINEQDDSVSLNLSTGDPRGAQYTFKIVRNPDLKEEQKNLSVYIKEPTIYSPILETKINGVAV